MNALADAIVAILFASVWQGALIGAAVLGLLALAPRASAATRHAVLWCGFLAIAAVPVAVALPRVVSVASPSTAASAHPSASVSTDGFYRTLVVASRTRRPLTFDLGNGANALAAMWLIGVLLAYGRLSWSLARVAQVRRSARRSTTFEGVPVCTSDSIAVPIAAGLIRPAVIVPVALMTALTKSDLDCILAHEVAHVRRGDGLSKLLQLVVQGALFFNPALLVLGRRLAIEREIACDDMAAAGAENRERFARCLVDLAERVSLTPASALGMFGVPNATLVRIRRLLDAGYSGRVNIARPLVGGVLVLVATLTLAIQAFSPIVAFATPATPKVVAVAPNTTARERRDLYAGLPWAALQTVETPSSLLAEMTRATACTEPARVRNPVPPDFPESAKGAGGPYTTTVRIVIDRTGRVTKASVLKSSGRADLDAATIAAARKSTYTPRIVGCKPVVGAYVFRADFSKD